jgi:hypothetical protein
VNLIKMQLAGLVLLSFCSGCASRYFVTDPADYVWKVSSTKDSLEYFVMTDVFRKTGNEKCSHKEKKHNMACLALKIVNHSNSVMTFTSENFRFQSEGIDIEYVEPMAFYKNIKQIAGLYLIYLPFNPIIVKQYITYSYVPFVSPVVIVPPVVTYKYYPIPMGLPIGIANCIVASHANKKLAKDLFDKQILGKTVDPSQTVYGYIYIKRPAKLELRLK